MTSIPVRAAWEVLAGIIPGDPMPEYTKQFYLTSDEWEADSRVAHFQRHQQEAEAYARDLQEQCAAGLTCNWTRIDFVWF